MIGQGLGRECTGSICSHTRTCGKVVSATQERHPPSHQSSAPVFLTPGCDIWLPMTQVSWDIVGLKLRLEVVSYQPGWHPSLLLWWSHQLLPGRAQFTLLARMIAWPPFLQWSAVFKKKKINSFEWLNLQLFQQVQTAVFLRLFPSYKSNYKPKQSNKSCFSKS